MEPYPPPGVAAVAAAAATAAPWLAPPPVSAAETLRLVRSALAQPRLPLAAAALATELARAFGCERVAVGVVRRGFARVLALSHGAPVDGDAADAPLLRAIGRAMDEALDQGSAVAHPPHPQDRPRITLAHAELAHRHRIGALLTLPLFADGEPIGALQFERPAGAVFDDGWAAVAMPLAADLAPLLRLQRDRDRPALARALARARHTWQALPAGRRAALVTLAVLPPAALAGLAMLPLPHQIDAPTRLEGHVQRAVVAPLDGYLKAVHVRAGDSVVAGQVLAELADEDLLLEQRRAQTAVAEHESAYGDAMARNDRAALVLAASRAAEARTQLAQVDAQLARARLVAPFDALVIAGDLSQQLGAPLERGDLLFTLTPSREVRVMLQIDERDIASVQPGQRGAVTLSALPERRWPLTVDRVMPVARVEDGRNVFEAQARLDEASPEVLAALRPGMQGVTRLDDGQRPLWWLLGHRAADWLRLQWWRWVG